VLRTDSRRRAFTLTEILMAVGILGVGLSMVASVFPVAVDQSRRSTESTMAALCARSAAAVMRARRIKVTEPTRYYFADAAKNSRAWRDRPQEYAMGTLPGIGTTADTVPADMMVYSPQSFLYDLATRKYDTSGTGVPLWNAGNYVPVVLATPIAASTSVPPPATAPSSGLFRITILVYKSRGVSNLPRDRAWRETPPVGVPVSLKIGAGEYIMDRTIFRGEAYLVDTLSAPNPGAEAITLGSGPWAIAQDAKQAIKLPTTWLAGTGTPPASWCVLPGVVAVFHTVIGD
jgi:prepilin-type N-terminal cleavage/methylation domain-containing protein